MRLTLLLNLRIPLTRRREPVNPVHNLTSSNQRDDNRRADHKRQDEAVRAVPWRCPAAVRRNAVDGVQAVEGEELRDQRILDGEQHGGPGDGGGNNTDHVARVALGAAVAGPFETPVDGAEEGENLWGAGKSVS